MNHANLWHLYTRPEAQPAAAALAAELARIPAPPCAEAPDAWFSDRADDREVAALCCHDCTAAPECLAFALANDERLGVWGGTDMGRYAAESNETDRQAPALGRGHTEGERSA